VRYLAATLLLTAALDWPILVLDRVGYAAAGFACLALALQPRPRRIRRAGMPAVPPATVALMDELGEPAESLADRLAAYGAEPASS